MYTCSVCGAPVEVDPVNGVQPRACGHEGTAVHATVGAACKGIGAITHALIQQVTLAQALELLLLKIKESGERPEDVIARLLAGRA